MSVTTAPSTFSAKVLWTTSSRSRGYDPGVILTRTPLRVSFAGGGTDLPSFFSREYGAVFSTAINKYVYVTVKRHSELFFEPVRVNYSQTEMVQSVDAIQNDIARECLRFMQIEPPIYVSTVADVPACTGLGGSSSFAVGLLHALHAYRGDRVSPGQLAEEATHIEVEVLKQPIGKQDQYAAAFGGLNLFCFLPDGGVTVEPQRLSKEKLDTLFERIVMFWTGMVHDSKTVLTEQNKNTPDKFESLRAMRGHAEELARLITNGSPELDDIGRILDASWRLKRDLASGITMPRIDDWYDSAMRAGAKGGKLCGAGGGGFLLLLAEPERQNEVRNALSSLLELRVRPEVHGSRVLLPFLQ
jgi:D-glycero-alpha-D-manno-heptose-7-phosphate kinase